MSTKVKELDARRSGDRGACGICNPKNDRMPEDKLWQWAQDLWEDEGGTVLPLKAQKDPSGGL